MKFTDEQRDAIKKAAEHIYAHQDKYEFYQLSVPRSKNDCGCVLGWISFFAGKRFYLFYRGLLSTAHWLGYKSDMAFYKHMNRLAQIPWTRDPHAIHRALLRLLDEDK